MIFSTYMDYKDNSQTTDVCSLCYKPMSTACKCVAHCQIDEKRLGFYLTMAEL